jgi:hypothetical protein
LAGVKRHMGQIFIHEEPHDIFVVRYVGDISGADVAEMHEDLGRRMAGKSHGFMLGDIHDLGHVSADGRRAGAELLRALPLRGSAVIGANVHWRAIATLIFKAVKVLNKSFDNPVRFFDTKAQALEWLAERRLEIAPPSTS